jgi:hypothetical protein
MARKLIVIYILTTLCLVFVASSVQAELNLADGAASGQWYNPARDGEGFYVEIIDSAGILQISVAMYSYNEQGNQLWLIGNVLIEDGDVTATVPVFLVEGPVWGTMYDPADRSVTEFGTIIVRFPTCDSALFSVNSNVPGLESGSYSLVRLTDLVGVDCVEPPPPAPPPPDGGITSGLWTGLNTCFFVNTEGTKIVESDLCDVGNALSADAPGLEVDIDGNSNPETCNAKITCDSAWDIVTVEQNGVEVQQVTCLNDASGIAKVIFNPYDQDATVDVYEIIELNGRMCYGRTIAKPAQ